MLRLCVSQQDNSAPYTFAQTGQRVYSFEEALYFVYHNWRLLEDEFLDEGFVAWVAGLGLSYYSSKVGEVCLLPSVSQRLAGFLRLADYFDEEELGSLARQLEKWESRQDFEKLKERADYFAAMGEPAKAAPLYRQAVGLMDCEKLLNNYGVALMQMQNYPAAAACFARALDIAPGSAALAVNLSECLILGGETDGARASLERAVALASETRGGQRHFADISYLRGILAWAERRHMDALAHLKEACELAPDSAFFVNEMAKKLTAMRRFDAALALLETSPKKDHSYYKAKADAHAAARDFPSAIRAVRFAINFSEGNPASLHTALAAYHRQDYDLALAELAIEKALEADPDSEAAKLERARIKKAQGRTRDYQAGLNDVLASLKRKYRENVFDALD